MQFPQVNINGTSKDALVEQPAGSYDIARREHDSRLTKLASVKAEIEAIAIHVMD